MRLPSGSSGSRANSSAVRRVPTDVTQAVYQPAIRLFARQTQAPRGDDGPLDLAGAAFDGVRDAAQVLVLVPEDGRFEAAASASDHAEAANVVYGLRAEGEG